MIYSYDDDANDAHGPALPLVELQVGPVGQEQRSAPLRAIVDSGADATVLPLSTLLNTGVAQVGRARLRWGPFPAQTYGVFLAVVTIGPHELHGIRILADSRNSEAVLGRDVLNQIVLTLNGPAGVVEIAAP